MSKIEEVSKLFKHTFLNLYTELVYIQKIEFYAIIGVLGGAVYGRSE